MNNQKSDGKPPDSEDNDHAQPMNLVATRPPTPASAMVTAFSSLSPAPNQQTALRPHGDPAKPGLMTLYFRTPTATRPPVPGSIMSPLMSAQVAPAQHFGNKQALKGIKVIRVPPNDSMQSQNSSSASSGPTLSPGILPNALAGNPNRHLIPAAVHSGISTGTSIIKGGHQVSQVGHTIHQPFSSHVPRGPAAVANISAGPRSGVATPIVRAPHSSGTMTLASSMISSNAHVRVRSQAMNPGRTVAPTATYAQVIDLQKNSIGHSLSSNPNQIGSASRSLDMGSSIRTGISHPASITITKPISISQPIVQHLQQVPEKSCLKAVSGISATTAPSNSTPAHQSTAVLSSGHSGGPELNSVCIVPTRTTGSAATYAASIIQFPATIQQHVPALRPALVQPQALSSPMNMSSAQGSQAFAVISAKTLPPNNQPAGLASPMSRPSIATTAVVQSGGSTVTSVSTLSSMPTRVLNTPNAVCQTAVPIAKVYPQTLPAGTQVSTLPTIVDSSRSSPFISQSGGLGNVSTLKTVVTVPASGGGSSTPTVVSNVHTPAVIKRTDSAASVRFAPLAKQPVGSGTSFAVSPAPYIYDQCPGTLAVHPYSVSSSNQGFSTALPASQLQTFALSQHGSNSGMSSGSSVGIAGNSSSPVQPLNSLMVAVDSRQVASQYNRVTIGATKRVAEMVTHAQPASTHGSSPSMNLGAVSQATSPHGTNHSQAGVPNHLSPRPSILRKRIIPDGVTSIAKRNLMTSLCNPDPGSPSSDSVQSGNLSAVPSPKPANGQLRENGSAASTSDSENCRMPLPGPALTIKQEPGVADETFCSNNEKLTRESRPLEASPRKKPRKQLLAANEFMETHSSDGEERFETKPIIKDIKTEDVNNVQWVTFCKKPAMSLLTTYRHGWKSRHNHFSRYSDVKPKEEKQPSVNELANMKGISEEVRGWKIHHLTGQMDDLGSCEDYVYARLSHWLELENKNFSASAKTLPNSEDSKVISKLTDLVKGNLQRSKIAQEQASESKQQIIKIFDHKANIVDIITKYTSRRQAKKKDKT